MRRSWLPRLALLLACFVAGSTVRAVEAPATAPAPAAPPAAPAPAAPAKGDAPKAAPAPATPATQAPAPTEPAVGAAPAAGPDEGAMPAPPSMEQAVATITKRLAFLPDVLATYDKDQKLAKKDFIDQAAPVLFGVVSEQATDDELKVRLKPYVTNAVNLLLVSDLATAAGVKPNIDEAKQRLAEIKQRFGDAALQGMSEERILGEMTRQSLIQQWVEGTVMAKIDVDPAEVDKLYNDRKAELTTDEQVHALHILKLVNAEDPAEKKAAAKKAIEDIQAQLKAGKDFAELAKANSDDTESAKQGGDLGFFEQKRVDPAFGKVAFALKPGETSDIVESEFGFHIIKAIEKRPAGQLPLDDKLRGYLTKYLKESKAKDTVTKTLADEATKRHVQLVF